MPEICRSLKRSSQHHITQRPPRSLPRTDIALAVATQQNRSLSASNVEAPGVSKSQRSKVAAPLAAALLPDDILQ